MASEQFSRTELLIGKDALEKLHDSRVIIFGVGGVGGFVCESLARAGVGTIDIVDNDTVALSNINRQIIALHSTVGFPKVDVMKKRIDDINPDCSVNTHQIFFLPENASQFNFSSYDYVIDAVDTVAAKIAIIELAKKSGVKVISCMGAGNKLDPSQFRIADIAKTSVCPLARVVRRELKKRGISGVKVLFSTEQPVTHNADFPASISFVPSVAGLLIAAEVVRDLMGSVT